MEITIDTLFHGRYRMLELKGRGAFGEVWLAEDEDLDMKVAIKIYIALDPKGLDDFKAEFKTVYDLNHPHLLHAYHYDVCDKRPYLVMPYCPSSAVSHVGCEDEAFIWKFIEEVGSGLAYLHSQKIIHRDIKPDNVLIGENEHLMITDFGISLRMRSTLRRNSERREPSSGSAGTLGYMAPELFSTSPSAVFATDVWALAATVYELFTGELPFVGQGGVMQLHGADVPSIAGASAELNTLISACFAKDPWDRPSAQQASDYARAVMNGETPSLDAPSGSSLNPASHDTPSDSQAADKRQMLKLAGLLAAPVAFVLLVVGIATHKSKVNAAHRTMETMATIHSADSLVNLAAERSGKYELQLMDAVGLYKGVMDKKKVSDDTKRTVKAKMSSAFSSLQEASSQFREKADKMTYYGETDAARAFSSRADNVDEYLKNNKQQ